MPNTPNPQKTPDQPGSRQVLTLILASLAVAPLLYIGLTYLIPMPNAPVPSALRTGLLALAVLATILGPAVERYFLDRATTPVEIRTAVIVSGALADVSAVLGLMVFLLSGQREWIFFIMSLLAYARLLMRLPEFFRLMDEKSR